jgi:hypothetical protein
MRRADPLRADAPVARARSAAPLGRLARGALGAAAVAAAGLALASGLPGTGDLTTPVQERALKPSGAPDEAVRAEGPGAGAWEEIREASPRFVLSGPDHAREPDVYSARMNVAGGGRLDQMAFGAPDGPGPYLRLTFYRPFDEPVAGVSFWLEMARRAGEAGLALERSPPVPELVRTRLGEFEIGVLRAAGPKGPRPCLGFRHQGREPDFMISGIACLHADQALSRQALLCALDAITLAPGQDDEALAAFFDRAGARACGPAGVTQGRVAQQGRR